MPTIDSPNFWFAVAASTLAVGAYGFVMLTIGRWLEQRQGPPAWVHMRRAANPRCIHCGGTGWVPDYEDRVVEHCACSKRSDEPLTAPVSGRAL